MERIISDNGVVYYRSELIPCVHGFSTRIGGVSRLSHTSALNLGVLRGDSHDTVLENLRLFSDSLGIDPRSVISVSQIHSSHIRTVDGEHRGEGFYRNETEPCDGYITSDSSISIGVRTADCVPILIYAPPNGSFVGAVSALHAGWKGTASGIAREAVGRLLGMGACARELRVAIGPAINSCCYEVRRDFYDAFLDMAGRELTDKFVLPAGEGIYRADLKSVNRQILTDCGVMPENIDVCSKCTCCEREEFFSHRYSNVKRGTMLSVITMKKRNDL